MANTLVNPNPALERGFANPDVRRSRSVGTASTMTINGTVNATAVLLFVLIASAALAWGRVPGAVALICVLATLGLGIYLAFRPQHAQVGGLIYAVVQGVAVGVISESYASASGASIVLQAVGLTIAILIAMLAVYRSGLIKVTQNFRIAITAAVAGVSLFYMVTLGAGLFGFDMPIVNDASPIGIGFSLLVVALASATLVVDFDFIERGAEEGLPKYMEWYGAFGLMVTIVWLYLELLRLLSKLQNR
jgi:uncharacterized YccA/Bax inhibitor family protein